ncbi:hypothetical protein CYY_007789 [Polysphondylium violaceum]|uniref:Structural maintenance of chromosomes protein 5 n=1 Tax=Polysphondylium violaceum TaxID=133409 RepID=A0A8J4UXT6_9MYCE|nr:hypothetical protein CYY_007789 [Polysphondylium violaceum]
MSSRKRVVDDVDSGQEEEDQEEDKIQRKKRNIEIQKTQNISQPTPSPNKTDEYVNGSIYRIKLHNIVTYSDVEFFPGPRLNVIIGPNGSGKSSIVCAIALGLGGSPNLLGRAKQLSDFIKQGTERGFIEIELFNDNGENFVIRRDLKKDNSSDFRFNGKQMSKNDVLKKIKELNVQIDNLCQFLPQDKVVCFASMSPKELLIETEKALAVDGMYENHMKLIELKKSQNEETNSLEEQKRSLDDLMRKNQALEEEVGKFHERQRYLDTVELLKKKKLWVDFEECKDAAKRHKEKKAELEADLKKKEDDRAPTIQTIAKLKEGLATFQQKNKEISTQILQLENHIQKNNMQKEDITLKIDGANQQLDLLSQRAEQKKAEVDKLKREIHENNQKITQLMDENTVKAQLEEKNQELRVLNSKLNEAQIQQRSASDNLTQLDREIHSNVTRLGQINNKREAKLNALRQNNPEVFKAYNIINQNADKFEQRVFGPVSLEINVENDDHAKYLEFIVPYRVFMSFIVLTERDKETFHQLMDKFKFRANVFYNRNPGEQNIHREIPLDRVKQYGITHYLDQTFTCEAPVRDMILDTSHIYYILAGSKSTVGKEKEILKANPTLRNFFTSEEYWSRTKSKYGNQSELVRHSSLKPSDLLSGINLTEKVELETRIAELKSIASQKKETLSAMVAEQRTISGKMKSIQEERSRISQINDERRKLYAKITHTNRKIQDLSHEEDEEKIRARLKKDIEENHKRRVGILTAITNHLIKQCTLYLERDHIVIKLSAFEGRVQFEQDKLDNTASAVDRLRGELNIVTREYTKALGEAKSKKALCDREAPFTQELFSKFQEFEVTTSEEIINEINAYETKAKFIISKNPRVLEDYENRKKEIESLTAKLEDREQYITNRKAELERLKTAWLGPVNRFIQDINSRFTKYFEAIKCAGEIHLGFNPLNPDDFAEYRIDIKVKFREEDKELKVLDAHVQSGGERSVSTMLFLISLQDLTVCPFRVVDEINQGMDGKNERMIFDQIVQSAARPGLPQYFLVTPKLLHNLNYSENTTVLCVFTGPWHMTQKQFDNNLKQSIANKVNS